MKVVLKQEFIDHHEQIVANLTDKIKEGFVTLDYVKMNDLMERIKKTKQAINYAKSGLMTEFKIYNQGHKN